MLSPKMNALTTTTTFCPNSFQLKLALGSRRSSLTFVRALFPGVDQIRVNFVRLVVRSSATNGNGLERSKFGNSSWSTLKSSTDGFSGWANADADRQSGDPEPKQSLVGIFGAGAAGVVLVSCLIFAALSMSKKSASRPQKEMVPLTTQQDESLSSDDNLNQVEAKNGENVGKLETSAKIKTDANTDPTLLTENSEATTSSSDDNLRQSSEGGDGSVFETVQRESANGDSLVALEATDIPTASDLPIRTDNKSTPSEGPGEVDKGELADTKTSEPSVFDASSENLVTDNPNWASNVNDCENSNLSLDPFSPEPSMLNISSKSKLGTVIESSNIEEEKSENVLSTRDVIGSKDLLTVDVGPCKLLNGTASIGAPLIPEVAYQSANERLEYEYNDINVRKSFFDSTYSGNFFTSAGIPAPSSVYASLQSPAGNILVPAAVDQLQSRALSALQVLKVIEDDVQPGHLCTRREYARWLVSASSALSRNTSSKVYPAMYIENVSELAFDDITPEDPDFPSIQGLAEAGLIASKLSRRDMQSYDDEDPTPIYFSPGSPLSRQDLVSWKMALEKMQLPVVDKKIVQQLSGFIDIDKIDADAWPAIVADLAAGEQGIITLAFGYTRLFQPEKPVTKAQAAIALSTGDASTIVNEELARIEFESIAEKAVNAHSVLVTEVERDLNARYEKELLLEREKVNAVEKMAEEARKEVEKLRSAREEESVSLTRERASVDSEMEVMSRLRREVEEQLQTLMMDKLEISYEKERLNKLRRDAETAHQEIERLQYELEVERKALSMARAWAEDEARRAREHAKTLDEARDRWDKQGIKVVVDSDLREEEAQVRAKWLTTENQFSVEETIERSETLVDKLRSMVSQVRGRSKDTIDKIIEKIALLISDLKKKAIDLKDDALHKSGGFSSGVVENTKRVAGDWKEGVERFSQKFKA